MDAKERDIKRFSEEVALTTTERLEFETEDLFANDPTPPPPDKGYAFVVLAVCFYLFFSVYGVSFLFGALITNLTEEYNIERGEASLASTIYTITTYTVMSGFGYCAEKFGYPLMTGIASAIATVGLFASGYAPSFAWFVFTYGFVMGLGSCCTILGNALLAMWFEKYAGLAFGLANAGIGVGTFVYPALFTYLEGIMGWKNSLKVMSGILALNLPLIFFYRKRVTIKQSKKVFNIEYFTNSQFIILFLIVLFMAYGYLIPFSHIIADGEDKGFTTLQSSLLLSVIGAASAGGRLIFGFISDFVGQRIIIQLALLFMTVITTAWPWLDSFPLLMAYGVAYGVSSGSIIGNFSPFVAEVFGTENFSVILGTLWFGWLSMAAGVPAAGAIYDAFGSYKVAGAMAGASFFIAFLLLLFIKPTEKELGKRQENKPLINSKDNSYSGKSTESSFSDSV
mmetsp:Transcript_8022/g.8865  ORF Transcript_8022/g.8865 Transcript_8022/m.8865 type:complete len:453 (-) Transcript_8022:245-1603(-)